MAIAGEAICGIVYGSQPLLYAVVSEILPRKYRPAAQGGVNASLAAGGIVALLAGSAMIKNYKDGFRIFWYFVAAILAVSAIICAICYNPPPRPLQLRLTQKQKLGHLDFVAYILLAIGTVLFVMGLSWGDNPYPWTDAHVLAPLLVGAAILAAFLIYEIKFKKDGLLHHGLFREDRNFAICLFVMFVDGMAFFAANNYYAFEVSVLYETDPIRVGLRFCMVFFGSIVSSLAIAVYASITKQVRLPIVVSFALFVVFFGKKVRSHDAY
jgi:MFS family permease